MVPVLDLKSNVKTDQQRKEKVVVKSMGLGVTLPAFNGMPGVSQATEKNLAQFLKDINLIQRFRQSKLSNYYWLLIIVYLYNYYVDSMLHVLCIEWECNGSKCLGFRLLAFKPSSTTS